MRIASQILAALAVCSVVHADAAIAADPANKITPATIRAVQIGLLKDLKNPPPHGELVKQLKERLKATVIASRAPRRLAGEFKLFMVGGAATAKDSFEELAKIFFFEERGENRCTGIFLDQRLSKVLTAGHCGCGRIDSYRIFRGDHPNKDDVPNPVQDQVFVLSAAPVHFNGYNCQLPAESQPGQDLALLTVEPVVQKTLLVEPRPTAVPPYANIATLDQVFADNDTKRLVGAGFGFDDTGRLPKDARAAVIPIASYFCSAGFFAASPCASFREFVLADPSLANRADSCGGDSGSPIFWASPTMRPANPQLPEKEITKFLVGIASRGLQGVVHNPGTTCGAGGIYTAVGHPDVIRWLSSQGVFVRSEFSPDLNAEAAGSN